MNALVDDVEVVPGPEGTEVRLHRALGGEANGMPVSPPPPPAPPRTIDQPVEVVRLEGDIDLASARRVEERVFGAVGNEALGLVVDLSGVRHLDSAGVRLLFQLASRLERSRQRLALVVPEDSPVRRVLVFAQLDQRAPLSPTVEEAMAQLRSGASQPWTML
jgi:anti-anti-sigma factor